MTGIMQYVHFLPFTLNKCLDLQCNVGSGGKGERRLNTEQTIKLLAATGHCVISHDCHCGGWAWDIWWYWDLMIAASGALLWPWQCRSRTFTGPLV